MAEIAPEPVAAAAPAKTTKKKPATKPKRAGPSVGERIVKAVTASKERNGISLAALKKALAADGYDVDKNSHRVRLAVKNLVAKEILLQTKGTGASGSFKVNKKKQEAVKKPAKKAAPKVKKPVAKKAVAAKKPKKVAAKKPATKKSPKKAKKPAAAPAKKAAKSPKKAKKPAAAAKKTAKSPKRAKAAKPKVAKPKTTKQKKVIKKK